MNSHRRGLLASGIILGLLLILIAGGCRNAQMQAGTPQDAQTAATDPSAQTVEGLYMGLSSGPLAGATVAELPEGIVLQSGELTVTGEQLDALITESAASPEEKVALETEAFLVAEQLAIEPLLEREAKQWAEDQGQSADGATIDAHLQSIAESVTVTDEDVRTFYDGNTEMIGGAPFEQVEEQVRAMVLQEKQQDVIMDHLKGLGERQEVIVSADFLSEVVPKALDNPVDRARRSGKPTFVDFGSEGCGPCDMMAPIIEELEAELGDRVNVVLIQVTENQHLASRYGIRSIPVQFVYDADGREVFNHLGFLGKNEILEELAKVGVE